MTVPRTPMTRTGFERLRDELDRLKRVERPTIIKAIAEAEAKEIGQRLFLTYCTQCHGSDAKGGKGFPNLADSDWLWGGTPDKIKESIAKTRLTQSNARPASPL